MNDGARLMLVPTGGFGWVIGDHEVAAPDQSECALGLRAVDELVERARDAGASVVTEPARQPWGYVGTFADPDGHLWMLTAN